MGDVSNTELNDELNDEGKANPPDENDDDDDDDDCDAEDEDDGCCRCCWLFRSWTRCITNTASRHASCPSSEERGLFTGE